MRKVFALILILVFALSGCSINSAAASTLPHLIVKGEDNPIRQIESLPFSSFYTSSKIAQLDELLDIVKNRFQPDFTNALPVVKDVYDAAIDILNRYILNSFSDIEKVHAIHDYLTYYIDYDTDLYSKYLEGEGGIDNSHDSFNLSGVFLLKSAVCDGIAKAFTLLCEMEGIRSFKATGEISDGFTAIPHAWNKVRIDGKWYNVDATLDKALIKISGKINSIIHHGYFLISDKTLTEPKFGRHRFSGDDPEQYDALIDYDIHSELYAIGQQPMLIKNQEQLDNTLKEVKNSGKKIGKIEVKLNFDGYELADLVSNAAYLNELYSAFKLVPNKSFDFNLQNKVYPFIRYPNGVFLLLIYK